MRKLALLATIVVGCGTVPRGGAVPGSCVIVGGPQAPVEVRIYDSDPYARPGGRRLFIGLLNLHEQHRIESGSGRIWYAFRWHEGDAWRGGNDVQCRDGERVELP